MNQPASSPSSTSLPAYSHASSPVLSARYIAAPMVGQSDLAWRLLLRRHGAQLVYTQMLDASRFVHDLAYRRAAFLTCASDRPLVVQFCANDAATFVAACQLVQPFADAVDYNLGCPQRAARSGLFGAYLLDEEHHERVFEILRAAVSALHIPVIAKIRLLPTLERTLTFCRGLRACGIHALAVHGRTRGFVEERRKGPADLTQVRAVVRAMREPMRQTHSSGSADSDNVGSSLCPPLPPLPVWSNGNVRVSGDIEANISFTGASGCMVGEALLADPTLFAPFGGSEASGTAHTVAAESAGAVAASAPPSPPADLNAGLSLADLDRRLALNDEYLHLLQHPPEHVYSPFDDHHDNSREEKQQQQQQTASTHREGDDAAHNTEEKDGDTSHKPAHMATSYHASPQPSSPVSSSAAAAPAGSAVSSSPLPLFSPLSVPPSCPWSPRLASLSTVRAHLYRVLNGAPHARFLHHTQLADEFLDANSLDETRAVMQEVRARIDAQRPFDTQLQVAIDARRASRQAARAAAERRREQREAAAQTAADGGEAVPKLNSKQRKRARWQQRNADKKRAKAAADEAEGNAAAADQSAHAALSASEDATG